MRREARQKGLRAAKCGQTQHLALMTARDKTQMPGDCGVQQADAVVAGQVGNIAQATPFAHPGRTTGRITLTIQRQYPDAIVAKRTGVKGGCSMGVLMFDHMAHPVGQKALRFVACQTCHRHHVNLLRSQPAQRQDFGHRPGRIGTVALDSGHAFFFHRRDQAAIDQQRGGRVVATRVAVNAKNDQERPIGDGLGVKALTPASAS